MNKRYIIYLALTAVLAGAAFWSTYSTTHTNLLTVTPAPPVVASSSGAVSSNKSPLADNNVVEIPVTASGTVLDAMRAYAENSSFVFTGENHPGLGFFVESINGKKNGNGYYWFLYVNGLSSETGASQTLLHPGDTVEWRFKQSD